MDMKMGIITDIHGNASALKAVLQELDKRKDIEHIFSLGDMIGIGPDTNEVLDILFARDDISMITGNHDEAVLALLKGETYPQSLSPIKEHHLWIADKIDKQFISKLEQLPRTIQTTIEGKQILFTHYHIEQEKLTAHISEDPFSPIVDPSLDQLTALFKGNEEDLICFGHNHPLHFFKNDQTIYLNPGALGCNSKPTAPYATVEIARDNIEVQLAEASYDNTNFLRSYELLKVPAREFIVKIFHGGQLVDQK